MDSLMATVSTAPAASWVAPADRAGHAGLGGRWCGETRCLRSVAWGIESWFAYVVALLFLLVRPEGLFGEKHIDRV